ncbi:MAG: tetratricopeptide repeat protein [Leptolyngbya sp. SIOISBB]|nr:tetratricopeptide repeat protein [Leptolyngbya sp. SIOISBB]
MKYVFSRTLGLLATIATLSGGFWLGATLTASAQSILEEQGNIEPALEEYPITIEAGDVIAIIMTSEDFDTVLSLIGPDGEEVAFNDDYGGTLNSRIVYEAEASGDYIIQSMAFDGQQGGDFDLEVRLATAYEMAFNQAQLSLEAQDLEGAIAAYSEAIELDASNPEVFLGRADAYFGQALSEWEAAGNFDEDEAASFEEQFLEDLDPEIRDIIVADFETAADLYEAEGDPFTAQSLREQVQYIETGEFPDATGAPPLE